ncbi:hydroxymethylpyrimidine/phosphomethylpyrimidine kinase [Wenzhouxiangella sp. XN24]|uniref:bifunctional hydroxymethylpyrimidine kinase/phosphomethylpyrimidine kinase n=1 Tax=Wenzhouxiangella sp. XN24 TaxID=2713569 RepID=UPI0013EDF68D|nr:hydroxymethylpyrimidine/phosphomethylpyrimidine kinase [Wenzhouxiangella sp. XN24]NGX15175.1 hydroxymethylpyrimidine/phosphomethylpyrimidine kinase [Wenzhouxiangella sp. XN24]
MSPIPPTVLVIAGNDPSGGAGIAADLQAISALGAHPAPVITALTVQDTVDASRVEAAAGELVAAQMNAVLADIPVAAVKIGLLATADIATAVAEVLARHPGLPVVLDPVLVAAGGARLAEDALVDVILRRLCPLTTLLTPNALEIRRLAPGLDTTTTRAGALRAAGCDFVLAKGGDEEDTGHGEVVNTLYGPHDTQTFRWPRLEGSFHGSGCTLASACAARIALGDTVEKAVAQAQADTHAWLEASFQPGRGQRVPWRRPR